MSKLPNEEADRHEAPRNQSTALLLLGDIADTSWRMFVPSIGLTLLGLYFDQQLGTTPWLLVGGMVFGIVAAYWLVRMQIKRVMNTKD